MFYVKALDIPEKRDEKRGKVRPAPRMEGKIPKEQQTTPQQVYTIINYILFLWDKIRSLGQGIIFLKARAESRREKREGKRHEWMLRRFIDRKFVYISHFPFSSFTIRREM
jgi:hypothetical protein